MRMWTNFFVVVAVAGWGRYAQGQPFVFDEPEQIYSTNFPDNDPFLSEDGLTMYMTRPNPTLTDPSIHVATRPSIDADFGPSVDLLGDTPKPFPTNFMGSVGNDGLALYYTSRREQLDPTTNANFVVTRSTIDEEFDFANPTPLEFDAPFASAGDPYVSSDGLTIVLWAVQTGAPFDADLYMATREDVNQPFGSPVNLQTLNSTHAEAQPQLSQDALTLFFYSDRPGGFGGLDIYAATREDVNDEFGEPTNLGRPINTRFNEWEPFFSEELSKLFFTSNRPGCVPNDARVPSFLDCMDIWQSTLMQINPGDFDRNGILDAADIDLLSAEVLSAGTSPVFDLDGNGLVEDADRTVWVKDVFGTFFGDANLDKTVGFDDFLSLANHLDMDGGWSNGDFDGSGDVQFADFLLLSANFGESATAVAAVPEPNAAVLLLVGLFGLVRRRWIVSDTRRA